MNKVKEWADKNLQGDKVIWAAVFGLSLVSILVVYSSVGSLAYRQSSTTEWILFKHTIHIFIGLGAMWLAHKVDYRYYSRLSQIALWISIPLLIYTFTNGVSRNDAARWIELPIFGSFQPSDFASLALIIHIASMLSKRQQNIDDIKDTLIPILMWCGAVCALIALSNVSTAVLLFATCMLIMFIGRVPAKYLAMLVLVGILAGGVALQFGNRWETVKSRVEAFVNGKHTFQAQQGMVAVASGGIVGKGPGNSVQRNVLPLSSSDFIYAIIIEEYGMIGGIIVLGLYLLLLHRGMKAAYNSERAFAGLLSAGLSFDLVCQAMVNMGVVVGLGPITGQTLPLISMGGTSMVFTALSVGIILSVSRGERDEIFDQKSKGEVKKKREKKENKNVEAVAA